MDENKAANTTVDTNAATTAENSATSQLDTGAPAASAAEQNTAPAQQNNAAQTDTAADTDVTQTQAFAARLKESTEKAVAAARAEIEKEYAAKAAVTVPEIAYTPDEKTMLETSRDTRFSELTAGGMSEVLALAKANEEMNAKGESILSGKKAAAKTVAEHTAALEAERKKNTPLEEKVKDLEAKLAKFEAAEKAKASNAKAAAASTGALGGETANDPDFVSSSDWDKLSQPQKEKFIKNGKIYQFMKKWK